MQSNALRVILAIILVALLGFGVYKLVTPQNNTTPDPNGNGTGTSFEETGNLVKNNPGMKPDAWHLVYEAPGQPAVTTELAFNNKSECVTGENKQTCKPDEFSQGARAHVKGTEKEGVVTVETLTFTETNGDHDNLIRVTSPQPYATVSSPLTITGEARGNWYFEASFPVRILDADGKELGVSHAEAQGDWMTEDFVPFNASLTFSNPTTPTGILVLEKDNPSGLPEHADEIRIPVSFSTSTRDVTLYFYDAERDKDENGNVMCSEQGLVEIQRQVPVTKTPIQDAINLLLDGPTTQEKQTGIDSEFPLEGLELKGANLKNGHLTLEFSDPNNKTTGGSCRVGVLRSQIDKTAKQFPEVNSVSFTPEELFQP